MTHVSNVAFHYDTKETAARKTGMQFQEREVPKTSCDSVPSRLRFMRIGIESEGQGNSSRVELPCISQGGGTPLFLEMQKLLSLPHWLSIAQSAQLRAPCLENDRGRQRHFLTTFFIQERSLEGSALENVAFWNISRIDRIQQFIYHELTKMALHARANGRATWKLIYEGEYWLWLYLFSRYSSSLAVFQ